MIQAVIADWVDIYLKGRRQFVRLVEYLIISIRITDWMDIYMTVRRQSVKLVEYLIISSRIVDWLDIYLTGRRDVLNSMKNCINQEELQLTKTHLMIEQRPLALTHHTYYDQKLRHQ